MNSAATNKKVKNVKFEDVKSPENNQAEQPVEHRCGFQRGYEPVRTRYPWDAGCV